MSKSEKFIKVSAKEDERKSFAYFFLFCSAYPGHDTVQDTKFIQETARASLLIFVFLMTS